MGYLFRPVAAQIAPWNAAGAIETPPLDLGAVTAPAPILACIPAQAQGRRAAPSAYAALLSPVVLSAPAVYTHSPAGGGVASGDAVERVVLLVSPAGGGLSSASAVPSSSYFVAPAGGGLVGGTAGIGGIVYTHAPAGGGLASGDAPEVAVLTIPVGGGALAGGTSGLGSIHYTHAPAGGGVASADAVETSAVHVLAGGGALAGGISGPLLVHYGHAPAGGGLASGDAVERVVLLVVPAGGGLSGGHTLERAGVTLSVGGGAVAGGTSGLGSRIFTHAPAGGGVASSHAFEVCKVTVPVRGGALAGGISGKYASVEVYVPAGGLLASGDAREVAVLTLPVGGGALGGGRFYPKLLPRTLRAAIDCKLQMLPVLEAAGIPIYPVEAPQSWDVRSGPAITFEVVSVAAGVNLDAADGTAEGEIEVVVLSLYKLEAVNLAESIRDDWVGFSGEVGGVTFDYVVDAGREINLDDPTDGLSLGYYDVTVNLNLGYRTS